MFMSIKSVGLDEVNELERDEEKRLNVLMTEFIAFFASW